MEEKLTKRQQREANKKMYMQKAKELDEKYFEINIIYIRVSTKNKGQDPKQQLNPIIDEFKLDLNKCMIIEAKESAFKINTKRELDVVIDIMNQIGNVNLYAFSLDRLYRHYELSKELYRIARLTNSNIYSLAQPFHRHIQRDEEGNITPTSQAYLDAMLGFASSQAQEESLEKRRRIKKSFKKIKNRIFTSGGKIQGRVLKYTNGKPITDPKYLDKLEKSIYREIKKKELTYNEIVELVKNKLKISISPSYLSNLKNKCSINQVKVN